MTVRFARRERVVWRHSADRVLVLDTMAGTEIRELHHAVAVAWLALDEPGTLDEVRARLIEAQVLIDDADATALDAAFEVLVDAGLVETVDPDIERVITPDRSVMRDAPLDASPVRDAPVRDGDPAAVRAAKSAVPADPVAMAVTVAASFGLAGARCVEAELHTPEEVSELLARVRRQRIDGVMAAAVEAGVLRGPGITERAVEAHQAMLAAAMCAEGAGVRALHAMASRGVEALVLKGMASAQLDYPSPSWRVFGDADLLVRASDLAAAVAAMEAQGFTRRVPPVRRSWERRFGRAVTLRDSDGFEIDLHLRIAGGYFGELIDLDDLWRRRTIGPRIAGTDIVTLDAQGRLLHACCHAVLGDNSGLRAARDVAQLISCVGADVQAVIAQAGDAVPVVAAAVSRAWRSLDLEDHPAAQWAASYAASPRDQQLLSRYQETFDSDWGPEGRSTIAALGPVDTVRFLAGLAWPSRASLRARGRGRIDHLRSGAATLRRR